MLSGGFKDFGFEKVDAASKTQAVQALFDRVASSYDLMNDVMSFGLHRLWKHMFVEALPSLTGTSCTVLDLAGGTGDITHRMLEKYDTSSASFVIADLSEGMLEAGRKRHPNAPIEWVCTNGETLPFSDETIDLCTMVFGLRNTTYPDRVLAEIFRVLKPGGSFHCLEFSAATNPILSGLYDVYSFQCIPRFGRLIAGDEKAYRYLVESIRRFPSQKLLCKLMSETGFGKVQVENYLGGIAAVHRGEKDATL